MIYPGIKTNENKLRIFFIVFLFILFSINIATNKSAIECNAKIIKIYEDYGTDIDGDNYYEFLTVKIGVNIYKHGEYTLIGYLNGIRNKEIGWSIDHRNLSIGDQTMYLYFDGRRIRTYGLDGPYFLNNISLIYGSSDTGLTICDYVYAARNTSGYNHLNFTD